MPPPPPPGQHVFQPPTGTRDFYPAEMLRRRYIEKAWRDVSIRHGFEEIDGPTFEHLDLYTVKSGEGIVSELFSFERAGGEKTYALRPEFTPTLARMYAAKANSLPKPTKWFWTQNCFRAERPQRGRLREFQQWNCDILGNDDALGSDIEAIACAIDLVAALGMTTQDVKVHVNDRRLVSHMLQYAGVCQDRIIDGYTLLDVAGKNVDAYIAISKKLGFSQQRYQEAETYIAEALKDRLPFVQPAITPESIDSLSAIDYSAFANMLAAFDASSISEWIVFDPQLARGLAYYTGMVFEVHEASGAERAIAGGGRYDGLVELFGGPPTPAVGFGMGDVVLSLVLQDRGLMPEGKDLLEKLSAPSPSLRPDAFVIAAGTPETADSAAAALRPTVAALRRAGLHARHSYKTTKHIGKLLKDADACHAKTVAIIESGPGADGLVGHATLRDLDTRVQHPNPIPLDQLAATISTRPRAW